MATTIEQQVALDEALVPSTKRLRIGISNFRLPSNIQSKESTLPVVYDVLRRSPFFKAFLVTADVPEIYMQEFWATAYVHQLSIRFKMRKNIVDLEAFRKMLHISPRVPGQSFDELPFEEEILDFLRFFRHSAQIKTLSDVNVNKFFQPWRSFAAVINKSLTGKVSASTALVSRHQNTQQYGAILPIELTTEDIKNTKAYKAYYAYATREAAPQPKASARRKRGGSDSSATPPTAVASPRPITTVDAALRLTAAAKGNNQPEQQVHMTPQSTDDGTGSKLGVLDVPSDDSEDEISWNSSDDEDVDAQDKGRDDDEGEKNDEKETESDEESAEEETREEEDESFDPIPRTPEDSEDDGNGKEDQGLRVSKEQRLIEEEEAEELYRDVDINQGRRLQVSQDIEDSHVTLTPVQPDGQQESSSVSSFVTSMLNPISDASVESIFMTTSSSIAPLQTPTPIMTPFTIATITTSSDAPIPPTTIPSEVLQNLPTFDSVFHFEDRVKSLEVNFSEFMQTSLQKPSLISRVKSQVKEQVSRILPRIEESMNAQLEAEVLTRSSYSSRTLYVVVADLKEMELKKILIEKMEGNKKDLLLDQTGGRRDEENVESLNQLALHPNQQLKVQARLQQGLNLDRCQPVSLVLQRNLCRLPVRWTNPHIRCLKQVQKINLLFKLLTKQADSRFSFNELLDTLIDLSNFIMNRLCVDTLTPELLAGPTYELMSGSCNSLTELEYHIEEVYKATTDQLDWVNPEGQQYPHNLLQPLPLIPDTRGRRVILFAHFMNNDLEYLRGGASSQKFITSMTKTKAVDYGHIKWIEDLVPRTMWIQEPLNYDKHTLWGVSHWGRKRQQFYGFAVNRESSLDVYSKRRIIVVTDLKIVEWHNYKHLDWISVRCDDDKIYKFKEGDFKRLRLQDIEDMLLILVQGKLSNLTVEERFAFNVSLRMFTRSIVIQRRVEDLQLGVESYQKRLNLTKPDTYRSDLKRREAYTAYSNPRGFIYQNKDKKNRLMRIDELYKFKDGTLNDVRNALDDRLKGIRMQYLPQTIWRKGDKDRAAAMI
nr:hypothetical protein [Tanacetum cinerariifolium]